jgi:hypothetical protein
VGQQGHADTGGHPAQCVRSISFIHVYLDNDALTTTRFPTTIHIRKEENNEPLGFQTGLAGCRPGWRRACAYVALQRGESINAVWIVVAAVCVYLIAYRFYSLFIAERCWAWMARA